MQVMATHDNDSRSQKVCKRLVFLGVHNSHWRYFDSQEQPWLCIVSKWGFKLSDVRTRHSIETMSHLNTLVVGDMGLLSDIAHK